MMTPSFLVQRRIETALRRILARCLPPTVPPGSAADLDRRVSAALAEIADELGEDGWPALPTPIATPPGPPPLSGLSYVLLHDDQRRDTEEGLWFARLRGIPCVTTALRAFARQQAAARRAPPLGDCAAEYAEEKRGTGRPWSGLLGSTADLAAFLTRFGADRAIDVPTPRLDTFVQHGRPCVVQRRASQLRVFFAWAVRRGYALTNPVPTALCRPVLRTPLAFTPRQARYILRETRSTDQIGFWILAFFGGLRTSEIKLVDRHPAPWSLISFRTGEFRVPPVHGGGQRARVFRMHPTLRAWLRWLRPRRVPFFPPNFWDKKFPAIWHAAFKTFPDRRTARTGYRKPPVPRRSDGLPRNTYVIYRIAAGKVTVEELTCELGDMVRTVRRRHDPTMPRRRARQFFALTPDRI